MRVSRLTIPPFIAVNDGRMFNLNNIFEVKLQRKTEEGVPRRLHIHCVGQRYATPIEDEQEIDALLKLFQDISVPITEDEQPSQRAGSALIFTDQ